MILNFGHCLVCGKPFMIGERFLRLSIVVPYQSQGYEDEVTVDEVNVHPNCLSMGVVEEKKRKALDETERHRKGG